MCLFHTRMALAVLMSCTLMRAWTAYSMCFEYLAPTHLTQLFVSGSLNQPLNLFTADAPPGHITSDGATGGSDRDDGSRIAAVLLTMMVSV